MSLNKIFMTTALVACGLNMANAQEKTKPEQTEVYTPVPKIVQGTAVFTPAPSDAVILFDGKDLSKWVMTDDRNKPAAWTVTNNVFTVKKGKGGGNIETKQSFGNYQLHIEWQVPANIEGKGQGRGNSGLFLASIGKGDAGYELQILDSYKNDTYTNGQAASIYKQLVPLANPTNKPGEWNSYDVVWTAPTFNDDKSVKTPARVTVLFNGVLVQDNAELKGPTQYIGDPAYRQAHGPSPIKLQSHGDPSAPLSFRNIWVREL
jgi:hypothetical protein